MSNVRLLLTDLPHRRTLRDPAGEEWVVWEVHAALAERRASRERRRRRDAARDRRENVVDLAAVVRESLGGWLAFRGRRERRRVVPIPHGWESMSDDELLALLRSAPATLR